MYRNSSYAFLNGLKNVDNYGEVVYPRGFKSKEILAQTMIMEKPEERVMILPFRYNNIFCTIAETIWVLGGRNDMHYLTHYMPRALDFSDDKKVWRGAYGPRLRNWKGVDQFREVFNILQQKDTKRAVMSIFDPAEDYQDSKDIPCNNWLQFLIRNNELHLNVTIRANDLFWGFSGINTFEWSVLQEIMSFWTNTRTSKLSFFIGSLHFYERHFKYVKNIISNFPKKTIYEFGFSNLKFNTPIENFDNTLLEWFELEKSIRKHGVEVFKDTMQFKDDFLRGCLQMLIVYNEFLKMSSKSKIKAIITELPKSDFKIAAIEFLYRKYKDGGFLDIEKEESDCLKQILNI